MWRIATTAIARAATISISSSYLRYSELGEPVPLRVSLSPVHGRLHRPRCIVPILAEASAQPVVIKIQKQAARKGHLLIVDLHIRPKLHRHSGTVCKGASHSDANVALRARHRFPVRLHAGPTLVGFLENVRPVGGVGGEQHSYSFRVLCLPGKPVSLDPSIQRCRHAAPFDIQHIIESVVLQTAELGSSALEIRRVGQRSRGRRGPR